MSQRQILKAGRGIVRIRRCRGTWILESDSHGYEHSRLSTSWVHRIHAAAPAWPYPD